MKWNPLFLYHHRRLKIPSPPSGGRGLARIFHELPSRDCGEGCATGQPQGVGFEAYLSSTTQGPTSEDARKDEPILGRSRQFVEYPGYGEGGNMTAFSPLTLVLSPRGERKFMLCSLE